MHAGFEPRDFLPALVAVDEQRALFFFNLAATRGNRNAVLHLGDQRFARGEWAAALQFYERGVAMPRPAVAAVADDEDGVDTLGLLKELPTNVWPHTTSLAHLYATMAEACEKSGNATKAASFYASASEEALADRKWCICGAPFTLADAFAPALMAKQGMMWAEKAASLE